MENVDHQRPDGTRHIEKKTLVVSASFQREGGPFLVGRVLTSNVCIFEVQPTEHLDITE